MDDDDDLKSNGISLLPTSSLFLPNRPNLIHSLWSLFFFLRQVDGTVASLMGQTAPGLPGFSGLWPIEVVVGLLSSHGWTTDCTRAACVCVCVLALLGNLWVLCCQGCLNSQKSRPWINSFLWVSRTQQQPKVCGCLDLCLELLPKLFESKLYEQKGLNQTM